MVIREAQKAIIARQQEIATYHEKVKSFQPIVNVPQRYLRGNVKVKGKILTPLAKRTKIRQEFAQRKGLKAKELKKVQGLLQEQKTYESEFRKYLKSKSGMLQYSKEYKLKGTPKFMGVSKTEEGKIVSGKPERRLVGYEYNTPYGTVTDYGVERQRVLTKYRPRFRKAIEGGMGITFIKPKQA